jgi:hypothetical protein
VAVGAVAMAVLEVAEVTGLAHQAMAALAVTVALAVAVAKVVMAAMFS